jgi:hypothetical protein
MQVSLLFLCILCPLKQGVYTDKHPAFLTCTEACGLRVWLIFNAVFCLKCGFTCVFFHI